ncbi:hypothetical protein M378DRAFT_16888 [Amanita muscaria Koide BX008]|uniref:Uncharacterized protein n=1 Tax=Amanita muscaria (strain Koide BX008) TaxID=946122 RepID=A0A0C2S1Y7_AMAMK|nr:hypothetical protein M378DRAFT_16888 [Amanita muscaria Koide BX008]
MQSPRTLQVLPPESLWSPGTVWLGFPAKFYQQVLKLVPVNSLVKTSSSGSKSQEPPSFQNISNNTPPEAPVERQRHDTPPSEAVDDDRELHFYPRTTSPSPFDRSPPPVDSNHLHQKRRRNLLPLPKLDHHLMYPFLDRKVGADLNLLKSRLKILKIHIFLDLIGLLDRLHQDH